MNDFYGHFMAKFDEVWEKVDSSSIHQRNIQIATF